MHDIECPYCGAEQDINHDDGQGYEEDEIHQQTCRSCDKTFVFTTFISFSYSPEKAPCLNGESHNWELSNTYPRRFTKWYCTVCGERKDLTEREMFDFLAKETQ